MMRVYLKIIVIAIVCTLYAGLVIAEETRLLKAKVSDIEGRPIEGAKLFLYDSSNVRRPADFITSLSDRSGRVQIALPPGNYWIVARFKSDGKYGPLMPGDKHSGEPLEVDMKSGGSEVDFVVADIRELGQKKRASATDALRLKGRVVDANGVPVAQAFVFANRSKETGDLPDYISAWTDDDGVYEVYLPAATKYFVGVSRLFPLKFQQGPLKLLEIEPGKIDIAIDINLTVQ